MANFSASGALADESMRDLSSMTTQLSLVSLVAGERSDGSGR
jgi:hypothetical protein